VKTVLSFGWNDQASSALFLSHAETFPEKPSRRALARYPFFSRGVQRNSTRAVEGFLIGGLPLGRLGVMGDIVRTQITLDKWNEGVYSVRTLNTEEQMKNWIVVIRRVRGHETERGLVASNLLTEAAAKAEAKRMLASENLRNYNVWAMPEESY
jgi:hypothetical protein